MKVCHVTSSHSKDDTRIFHNECKSLVSHGYEVFFIVNGLNSDEICDGVNIVSSNFNPKSRIDRWFGSISNIKKTCLDVDADVYHLHDPELLSIIPFLKKNGKKVIFDSHEDYALLIGDKKYIPKVVRPIVRLLFSVFEKKMIRKVDAAIVCYHWTKEKYDKICNGIPVELILNFPRIGNKNSYEAPKYDTNYISYAGNLSSQWCHEYIIKAIDELEDINYLVAGKTKKNDYYDSLKELNGWDKVNTVGMIPLVEVEDKIYRQSFAGMALLDYISQCKGKIGNLSNTKFFEYMKAGIPLICTDFILWKEIIEAEKCGICVNPHNIEEIKAAILYLYENKDIAKEMGANGRRAVEEKYNWEKESAKLIKIYKELNDI